MKPMSAHDEKTLNTAVAMANEITSRSMNDLGGGDVRTPSEAQLTPSEKSKFHFKFPLSLHHGNHAHEPEKQKDETGKNERRNFSDEAKSVPDLQSTITEEGKMAYTSLIEEPAPSTSLMFHIAKECPSGILKLSTVPKPSRAATHVQFHSLQKNVTYNADSPIRKEPKADEFQTFTQNVLPLPPRTTKPKLIDKPRHIRKYPLKLPDEQKTEPRNQTQAIIYQNTKNSIVKETAVTDYNTIMVQADFDEVDSSTMVDQNTNPFSNVAGPSSANPFSCFYDEDDDDDLELHLNMSNSNSSSETNTPVHLIKDCKDHVSVEDLLAFADQKPCGRQRGVESDEVRIMVKVLQEEVSQEQCLEALELSDWNVHLAIKMMRVKAIVGTDVSFDDCHAQLKENNGDITKAATVLGSKAST